MGILWTLRNSYSEEKKVFWTVTLGFLVRHEKRERNPVEKPFALIIEDDRDIVALFRHVMDLAGYRTEIILNGKVAADYLATPGRILFCWIWACRASPGSKSWPRCMPMSA